MLDVKILEKFKPNPKIIELIKAILTKKKKLKFFYIQLNI